MKEIVHCVTHELWWVGLVWEQDVCAMIFVGLVLPRQNKHNWPTNWSFNPQNKKIAIKDQVVINSE